MFKKLFKGIKKVVKPIRRLKSKAMNVATLGLWDKTKKIRHKIIKSKAFRVVVGAATVYFGGAALMAMAGGGTASAGIGSAWAGVKGAGSALASGSLSGAGSALSTGFTSGAQMSGFAAGAANATANIGANATAAGTVAAGSMSPVAGGGSVIPGVSAPASTPFTSGLMANNAAAGGMSPVITAGSTAGATTTGQGLMSKAGGLASKAWGSLGEAGKAAAITGGMNAVGSMIEGNAEQKAMEEARKRRSFWGMDGEGNTADFGGQGLMAPAGYQPMSPGSSASPRWKTTIDDLIQQTNQRLGG